MDKLQQEMHDLKVCYQATIRDYQLALLRIQYLEAQVECQRRGLDGPQSLVSINNVLSNFGTSDTCSCTLLGKVILVVRQTGPVVSTQKLEAHFGQFGGISLATTNGHHSLVVFEDDASAKRAAGKPSQETLDCDNELLVMPLNADSLTMLCCPKNCLG